MRACRSNFPPLAFPPEHVDVAEYARRRRVPYANDLRRLALAAKRRSQHAQRVGIADALQAPPEVRADAAVIRILDDVRNFSIDNQPAALAAELEFVARVVD